MFSLERTVTSSTFAGVIPPILTPYSESGSLDHASLHRLIEAQVQSGVDGLFMLGSTGETAFLTDRQRIDVLTSAVDAAAGRVPVIAGVNDMTLPRVIEQTRRSEGAGVAAIVATAPFYAMPAAEEVEAHFRVLAEETRLPIFAYDVPVRVHRKLDHDLMIRLGLDGVIIGVKDSSGDDVAFRRLVAANRLAGSPLRLFTGHEVVVDGALLAGADGVVPGLGNVDPAGYVRMYRAAKAQDWETVRSEQDRLAALFEIVFQAPELVGEAGGIGAFKTALTLIGLFDSNLMSPPIRRLSGTAVERIHQIVRDAGLIAS